jgi:predicted amidohydrolase
MNIASRLLRPAWLEIDLDAPAMNELPALDLCLFAVVRTVTASAATMLAVDGEAGTLTSGAVGRTCYPSSGDRARRQHLRG